MPLLVRPRPIPDESLLGYMARLARQWPGGPEPFIAHFSGGYPTAAATVPFDLKRLSKACTVPPCRLSLMAYWPIASGRCNFLGHSVDRDMISVQRRRVCPDCLRASPHHRALWDLVVIDLCPVHRTPLIRKCPTCGSAPRWNGITPAHCGCGHQLSRIRLRPVEGDITGILEIAHMVGCRQGLAETTTTLSSGPLSQLDVGDCLSLVFHLGWWASGATRMPRPIALAAQGFGFQQILADGFHACRNWPHGFVSLLDRLRTSSSERPGRFGIHKEFGAISAWVAGLPDGPLSDLLAEGFAAYAAAYGDVPTRSSADRLKAADAGSTMTLCQAARLLRRSIVRVHAILARDGLVGAAATGKGAPVRIDRQHIASLKTELNDLVGVAGLASMLGCGETFARALIAKNVIPCAKGAAADLFGQRCWRRLDVNAFVAAMEARASDSESQPISILGALKILRAKGITASATADAVSSGLLSVVGVDPEASGLGRILVDRKAVMALGNGRDPQHHLSIPQAARALGVKDQVAYAWVRAGLLPTCGGSSLGRHGDRVDHQAIEGFRSKYLLGRELESGLKVSRGWAAEQLIRAGANPVSGPTVDGSPFVVFRRDDAIHHWALIASRVNDNLESGID